MTGRCPTAIFVYVAVKSRTILRGYVRAPNEKLRGSLHVDVYALCIKDVRTRY